MAQELYKTTVINRKGELIALCLRRWRMSAENYRVMPIKYAFLLKEKRRLKLQLNRISDVNCNLYPDISFYRIIDENEAREYLERMQESGLEVLMRELDEFEFNYAYKTMQSWISEAQLLIARKYARISDLCNTSERRMLAFRENQNLERQIPIRESYAPYLPLGL